MERENDDSTIESIVDYSSDKSENFDGNIENDFDHVEESNFKSKVSPVKIFTDSQRKRQKLVNETQRIEDLPPIILNFTNHKSKSEATSKQKSNMNFENINLNKRRKVINQEKKVNHETADTWVNQSKPLTMTDLYIHKKKLEELKNDLDDLIFNKTDNRILVISGPSGSGKSTSARLIANLYMKNKINHLRQSIIGSEISDMLGVTANSDDFIVDFNILKDSHKGNSSMNYFGEFLDQCKLLTGLNEKCVIIEELPNLFHKQTHYEFQKAIKDWLDSSLTFKLPPLIICITEFDIENDLDWSNATSFSIDNVVKVETIFGFRLMEYENFGWKRLKFNRVAKTFLKKALNRVLTIEKIKKNGIIDRRIDELSNLGDFRNAINTLEFWYKFQYDENSKENREENYDELIKGKESGLDIFHSIGKIIYGTKHEDVEFADFQKRYNLRITMNQINSSIITIDNVSNEVMSHLIKFNLCCLENYSLINPAICEELNKLMDIFSLTDDIVSVSNKINKYNSIILHNASFFSCFGLRIYCELLKNKKNINENNLINNHFSNYNNKKKVMFGRDSKLRKKLNEVNNEIDEFQKRRTQRMILLKNYSHLNKMETILIDGFYQSNIMSSFKYKYKRHLKGLKNENLKIDRIGGRFTNSLIADDEFKAEQNDDFHKEKPYMSKELLERLESEYFGINNHVDTEANNDEINEIISGGEFDSDPLEDESELENNGDGKNKVYSNNSNNNNTENDEEDIFSDDSIVLDELF